MVDQLPLPLISVTGTPTECGIAYGRRAAELIAANIDTYARRFAARDENGFGVVTVAEAGMVAKTGLNSAGVGLCVNLLLSDRDGRRGGVPYHVVLRAALEADCLTLAIRAVAMSPRSASVNILL